MRIDLTKINIITCRKNLDYMNGTIALIISKRVDIVRQIATYKQENNLPIINKNREKQVILSFEREFIKHGMKPETGRILAKALIDIAIIEEQQIIENI